MKVNLTINIPAWLDLVLVWPLLLYRRFRFGYPFRRIPLTQSYFAIVDPLIYYDLIKYKWRVCKNKHKKTIYAERSFRKQVVSPTCPGNPLAGKACLGVFPIQKYKWSRMLMHKQVIGDVPPGFLIDHANNNGLDNRRANLRIATVAQNAWNTRPRKSLAMLKGVTFCKDKQLWRGNLCVNGQRIHLGYFETAVAAARAYDRAAREYHGEFARLNNI